ncbi:MAG: hypothetical protein WDN04_23545 [Rhodospirillales bacterium]
MQTVGHYFEIGRLHFPGLTNAAYVNGQDGGFVFQVTTSGAEKLRSELAMSRLSRAGAGAAPYQLAN